VTDQEFTDVTLACSGGKYLKAHRVILSSFSSTLKKIIFSVKEQNPVIYLKGFDYDHLRSIVTFIYLGETKVEQNSFADFMEIAQELNIRGLAAEKPNIKAVNEDMEGNDVDMEFIKLGEAKSFIETIENNIKSDEEANYKISHDIIKNSEDNEMFENNGKNARILNYQRKSNHSEVNSQSKFQCNKCDKTFSEKGNLKRHVKSLHEGVFYPCKACDYKATQTTHLKEHMKSKHSL